MTDRRDRVQAQLADARQDARQAQILDAATQVFADKGYHGTTIREIARTAGIADGTIYLYFKSKADLLLGILNRINESERRSADLARSLEGVVDVRRFFAGYVRHRMTVLEANMRAFRAVLPAILMNAELRERYMREVIEPSFALTEPVFEQWIAAGAIRPVEAALALRGVLSAFLGLLVLRLLGDRAVEERWDELPELLTGMIFDGLGTRAR